MNPNIIQGSLELGEKIKQRRNELGLTIEQAASIAGIGTKTWSRYESGESIRNDKVKGICKALRWLNFSECTNTNDSEDDTINLDKYINHEAWSSYLADTFGKYAAASFAIGSDIVLDHLNEDIQALLSLPRGSHMGELDFSFLQEDLPSQFLVNYDYDFLYHLRSVITDFRLQAANGTKFVAHSVLDELALYLILENSRSLMELAEPETLEDDSHEDFEYWDEWIYDLFEDSDLITFLYSGRYINSSCTYHFDHWLEQQFWCD